MSTTRSLPFSLLMALVGLFCGLAPQLLLHLSIGLFNSYLALLAASHAVLFFSLSLVLAGAALTGRLLGAPRPRPGLRPLLILDAATLAALWQQLLNPFPSGPLLQYQQYLPLALSLLAPLLALALFAALLKKFL